MENSIEKRWRIRPHDSALITRMERSAGVSSVVARLLAGRGLTHPTQVQEFLDAKLSQLRDPETLPGLSEAADRIHAAIASKRRIIVYGDYDADGMTATAILLRCLGLVGANVGYYVPNRMDEGYGINHEALTKLAEAGASQIVSVDCGIGSVAEAETALRLGLELIITDHHQPGPELPPAAAIVHPALPGHSYPFPYLCGAGVAFKLAWAVCQRMSQAKKVSEPLRNFLLSALGLAAIGTVADVVPLVDENRILVKHGLRSLQSSPTLGLAALARLTGLASRSEWTSEDVSFNLGPRLNAAGRLGQAQLGVELLATDKEERAQALAEYIEKLNENRLHLERSIYLAASKQVKERFDPVHQSALVLADRGWHQGVIGIVAGKLAEKYHRPVVVISLDELGSKPGTGSVRSIPGLNVHDALSSCSHLLIRHGGHAAAAGLRIDESQVDDFRAHFCQSVEELQGGAPPAAELTLDAEISLPELTIGSLRDMERLAPFGQGNPRPLLCTTGVRIADKPRTMGQGDRHLSLSVEQLGAKFRALAFNRAEWIPELAAVEGEIDLAFRPTINDFRGRQNVELQIADWRPSRASVATG